MAPQDIVADRSFGPQYLDYFDFTLHFQEIIFGFIPAIVAILWSPFAIWWVSKNTEDMLVTILFWGKAVLCTGVVAVDAACLGAWVHSPEHSTDTSVPAAALSFVAALSISAVVLYSHLRSLQSTSLASMYLSSTFLFDAMRARSCYMRDGMHLLAVLSVSSAAIKFCLVAAEELYKRKEIADKELKATLSSEALSGFWNRSLFVWINAMIFKGYRHIMSYSDMAHLGPEFAAEKIHHEFNAIWEKSTRTKYCLIKTCFRFYYVPFLITFLPEICNSTFNLLKPLYLRRAIEIVGQEHISKDVKNGLVGSLIIIFIGIAIAKATAMHLEYRLATKIRGALVMTLFQKSLTITYADAKESAAVSLMSTDIDGIVEGIPHLCKMIAGLIEACVGVYILTTFVKAAAAIAVGAILLSAVSSFFFGKVIVRIKKTWNEAIEVRVAKTSAALAQLKNIKMMGLGPVISKQIQKLRVDELEQFKRYRYVLMYVVMSIVLVDINTPVFLVAGAFFTSIWHGHLSSAETFGALLVLAIITKPLMAVMQGYQTLSATAACFQRVQTYLLASNARDLRTLVQCGPNTPSTSSEKTYPVDSRSSNSDPSSPTCDITFSNASVGATENSGDVIKDVSLSFKRSTFSIVLGPTGTGKTTFLRAVLGEASFSSGSVSVQDEVIAYCAQTPWIRNESIRNNILSGNEYDPTWYESVVNACLLNEDLQQLPRGELSRAGDNGGRLSGGQKHRVALARALYSRAPIIVLDDVFSALDKRTGKALFTRVFGMDGIVRRSQSTVLLATHSIEYVQGADQVILIDSEGGVKSQHDLDSSRLAKSFLEELSKADAENEKDSTKHEINSSQSTQEPEETKPPQQSGDFTLYSYFFASVPKPVLFICIVAIFLTNLSEVSTEIFMRGWIEVAPDDGTYFAGFFMVGLSSCVVGSFTQWLYYYKTIPPTVIALHKILLDKVIGASHDFFATNDKASLLNRFTQDMALLTVELPWALFVTGYFGGFMIIKAIVVAIGMKYTAPVIIVSFVLFYLLGVYYLRTSRQIRFLDLEARAPLFAEFIETASGVEHIRAFGWQKQVMSRAHKALDHSQRPFYYMYAIQRWLLLSLDLLTLILSLAVVLVALYAKGSFSQPGFALSLFMAIQINSALTGVINSFAAVETALGAVSRLRIFANTTPQEKSPDNVVELPKSWPDCGEVILDSVTAKYDSSKTSRAALDDVSIKISAGETVCVVGRTGSGKSTLVLTLLKFLEYTGSVTIDGIDISQVPHDELRSRITTVSQEPVVLQGSLRDNMLPYDGQQDGAIDDAALEDVLRQICLFDHITAKGGLDAPYADMGFSHGQAQLCAIGRAILYNTHAGTKLVLMDEPTSNVDVETDAIIQRLIGGSFGKSTVIVISHRAEAIQNVDVTLEVSDGKVTRVVG